MEVSDKEFYEKLSGKELSEQEIFEARSNFVGFFDLLYRVEKKNNGELKSKKAKKFT